MVAVGTGLHADIARTIKKLDTPVAAHERRFVVIQLPLQQLKTIQAATQSADLEVMNHQVSQLEATRLSSVDATTLHLVSKILL